jgi:hypothetical protein
MAGLFYHSHLAFDAPNQFLTLKGGEYHTELWKARAFPSPRPPVPIATPACEAGVKGTLEHPNLQLKHAVFYSSPCEQIAEV